MTGQESGKGGGKGVFRFSVADSRLSGELPAFLGGPETEDKYPFLLLLILT